MANISKSEQRKINESEKIWKKVKTFSDLQNMMARVVQGEFYSPFYPTDLDGKRLYIEDALHSPVLSKMALINRLGIVTINSQPGNEEYGDRAYVIGVCHRNLAEKLTEMINRHNPGYIAWYQNDPIGYDCWMSLTFSGMDFMPDGNDSMQDIIKASQYKPSSSIVTFGAVDTHPSNHVFNY